MKTGLLKKRFIVGLIGIVSISTAGAIYASSSINISLNGHEYVAPEGTKIENGQTLVPLRWISEELGAKVVWDNEKKSTNILVPENRILQAQIDSFITGISPTEPKKVVELWLQGVRRRSGAIQYAVLAPNLQEKIYDELSKNNWVTGGSSPWIADILFVKEDSINDKKVQYTIEYNLKTSAGIEAKGEKVITVEKNLNYPESHPYIWYITEIKTKETNCEMYTPAETIVK